MTTNAPYLHDELSRRIAQGRATASDLALLQRLIVCRQRRFLALGLAGGAGAALMAQTLIAWLVHAL